MNNRVNTNTVPVDVADIEVWVREIALRIPFEYGVTRLTTAPHVVLQAELRDGSAGVSAQNLALKWFSKDKSETVTEDLEALRSVVLAAADHATALDPTSSVFEFWLSLADRQAEWAGSDHPKLRSHMGVALVERAVIDAVCRAESTTLRRAIRDGRLGIDPGTVHGDSFDVDPAEMLPGAPNRLIRVRHTVGGGDPLRLEDVDEPVNDGLPEALTECIDRYGLTHFKLKGGGDPAEDADRLRAIARVVEERVTDPVFTFDANEQYERIADLRALWDTIRRDPSLDEIKEGLRVVEQPFPRSFALDDRVSAALLEWDGPPIIIDESDAAPDDLSRALELGYVGTSVKSCKGVCKSIANAVVIAERRQNGEPGVCTAEDLTTVGPIDLLQDLALVSTLCISHAERNGHHYLYGLSQLPAGWQAFALDRHGDLYREGANRVPTLAIDEGSISTESVVTSPYGVDGHPTIDGFEPLESWIPSG